MLTNLENSAVVPRLEKVSFHSNLKERQYQRVFKLLYNYAHLTIYLGNAQNLWSWALAVYELRTCRCTHWIYKRQRNWRSNCQYLLDHWKSKRVREKHLFLLRLCQSLWLWITTNCGKFFKRWGYQTTLPASWEICMQVKKTQNWTWNNRLVPN